MPVRVTLCHQIVTISSYMHQFSRNSVLTLNNHKKVVALALLILFLGGTGATGMFILCFWPGGI